jgi:hypothetical protein
VSAPSTSKLGMLARLSQAVYLLGKVLRHKHEPTDDPDFNQHERLQIDKSLRALLKLAYQGNSAPVTAICPQTAMCFGALIELHFLGYMEAQGPGSLKGHPRANAMQAALNLLRPIAGQACQSSSVWFRSRPFTLEQASPLLLPWTYQAAITFLRLAHWFQVLDRSEGSEPGGEDRSEENQRCIMEANQGAASMMRKLSLLGSQWCASGT